MPTRTIVEARARADHHQLATVTGRRDIKQIYLIHFA